MYIAKIGPSGVYYSEVKLPVSRSPPELKSRIKFNYILLSILLQTKL